MKRWCIMVKGLLRRALFVNNLNNNSNANGNNNLNNNGSFLLITQATRFLLFLYQLFLFFFFFLNLLTSLVEISLENLSSTDCMILFLSLNISAFIAYAFHPSKES